MPASSTPPTPAELGLGRAWARALEHHDVGDDPQTWRRSYVLRTDPLTPAQLRALALAMAGHNLGTIRQRAAIPGLHSYHLRDLGLAAALRYVGGDAPWRLPRPPSTGHRLLTQGLPPRPRGGRRRIRSADFLDRWLAGAPLATIGAELGASRSTTERLARAAQPPRWQARDVTAYFGWSPDNYRQRLLTGKFPAPDGQDGMRRWWWPSTITAWADAQGLTACPECGARVKRLVQHQVKHRLKARSMN